MRLISAMSESSVGQSRGYLFTDKAFTQAVGAKQILVRAEFVDEVVFQTESVERAGCPTIPRDLLHQRRQAVALGMLFNDQHGLKLVQNSRDARHVERLERVDRNDGNR